jgi:hypothetical protein
MRIPKFHLILTIILLNIGLVHAQKKEKIKGSKFITVSQHDVDDFDTIEILDDLEIYLIASDKPQVEIEADDNLHDIVEKKVVGNRLVLSTKQEATGAKKFQIRVLYTPNLKLVEVKDDSQLNALQHMELPNITVKNFDNSKSFLNVKSQTFTLILTDKSKAELNFSGENASLELNKNVSIKALITSNMFKLDMYQKASATIEGDVAKGKIRLDNDATYKGKNMTFVNLDVLTETNSKAVVTVKESINISASGKSEIEIYGAPTFTIKQFAGKATLYKK